MRYRVDNYRGQVLIDQLNAVFGTIQNDINNGGGGGGGEGEAGKSLEFNWDGTSLGVRVEGEAVYQYVDLKGATGDNGDAGDTGDNGKSLEFNWDGTSLGVRVEGDLEYQYVDLQGSGGGGGATIPEWEGEEDGKALTVFRELDRYGAVNTYLEWRLPPEPDLEEIRQLPEYDALPTGEYTLVANGDTNTVTWEAKEEPSGGGGADITTGTFELTHANVALTSSTMTYTRVGNLLHFNGRLKWATSVPAGETMLFPTPLSAPTGLTQPINVAFLGGFNHANLGAATMNSSGSITIRDNANSIMSMTPTEGNNPNLFISGTLLVSEE